MSRPKIAIVPLSQLPPRQLADCFALLAERVQNATREGKPFYTCRFRDRDRSVTCMVWADSPWFDACESEWREGQCYKLRCVLTEHERYGPQIELYNIRPVNDGDRADGFDRSRLVPVSRLDPHEVLAELLHIAHEHIEDEPLRRLVVTLLDRHGPFLAELPASDKFYPFYGGWLEHVWSVTRNCLYLVNHYRHHYADAKPPLNRDLVLAAALLHDIGRVREFADDPITPQQSVPGALFGHLLLGRDMVHEAALEQGDVDPELLQLLEHIIVAHLTLPAWGSLRLPMIPEVLILHHADDLDAKIEMYLRCLSQDRNPGPFTARDPILNKPLLKERKR